MPKEALVTAARAYDSAGVAGVWSPQLFGAPFGTLSAIGAVTERVKLGTGIALAFVRSSLETACGAIDLDLLSGGRCVLGLGSSAESQVAGSFGRAYGKPLATPHAGTSTRRKLYNTVVPHYGLPPDKMAEYAARIAALLYH
jgi:alkanesulfonate monooxygenase SsuD/methylene tetrahydromethanopterin reductase-like flavin-dependent oxidoreductase (luciferase family)